MSDGGQLYENLRALISVVDELRDCGLQNYISLPRIVACGTQSSGKSSLIESVVGIDFLPRGGGVVTRRPLELRLVHLSILEHPEGTAWGIFDGNPTKFTDFEKVRLEIERLTDEVAGANKGIVDDPIILTVYATGAPDLTLIDLPGITRVPLRGSDQVEDIEKLTREMTLKYVKDPRTIIMAVLPANQDISVSDALQMARQVDPKGNRTIGVITKIDIMDQGTDACRNLRGDDIPLKLGYVGVKMRSQKDIDDKVTVKNSIGAEKEWFGAHRLYSKLPPGMVGTDCLINKLTTVLFKHIRNFLPEIKREINEKRRTVEGRLAELGNDVPLESNEKIQLMWTMVTDFTDMFKNSIRGRYDRRLQVYMGGESHTSDVSSGSQIRQIFSNLMNEYIDERQITSRMSDDDIEQAIRIHEGDALPGFPSPDTFEFLIIPQLRKLSSPSVECVNSIAACLDALANRMSRAVLRRFPKLSEAVLSIVTTIIQREKENAQAIVEQLVTAETSYLFTNDLQYLGQAGVVVASKQQQQQAAAAAVGQQPGQAEAAEQQPQGLLGKFGMTKSRGPVDPIVTEIRKRLDAYFGLIVRNVRDVVPKTIGFFLVRKVEATLQFELLSALNKDGLINELLGEPPHIHEERKQLTGQLKTLQKATSVLMKDATLAGVAFDDDDVEPEAKPAPKKAAAPMVAAAAAPAYQAPAQQQFQPQARAAQIPQAASPAAKAPGAVFGGGAAPPQAGGGLFGGGAAQPAGGGLFGEAKQKPYSPI